jgi:hypothetical protein
MNPDLYGVSALAGLLCDGLMRSNAPSAKAGTPYDQVAGPFRRTHARSERTHESSAGTDGKSSQTHGASVRTSGRFSCQPAASVRTHAAGVCMEKRSAGTHAGNVRAENGFAGASGQFPGPEQRRAGIGAKRRGVRQSPAALAHCAARARTEKRQRTGALHDAAAFLPRPSKTAKLLDCGSPLPLSHYAAKSKALLSTNRTPILATHHRHEKRSMKKSFIIGIYSLIVLFTTAPIISVVIASTIASKCGCRLDEGNVHSCMVLGHDLGPLLYQMFVAGWFMLLTIPSGLLAFVAFTITVVVEAKRARKRSTPPKIVTN